MNRSSFGFWGLELPPEEFAQALAALGVLEGLWWREREDVDRTANRLRRILETEKPFVPWQIFPPFQWPPLPTDLESAAVLAKAWEQVSGYWPRLELFVGDYEPFWLLEELSRPEVGAQSVYVRVDEPAADIGWNWPLVVGFLGDPSSRALRQSLERISEEREWLNNLVRLVNVESNHDACDLLLAPLSIRAALASVLQANFPVRADCIIILEELADPPQQSFAQLKALRAQVGIAAVAQAYVSASDRANWFRELVRELSHNVTLDVALRSATQFRVGARAPVLVAPRRLVEFAYVSQYLFRLADRFERPEMAEKKIKLDLDSAYCLRLHEPEREYDLNYIAKHIRENSKEFALMKESETASASVKLEQLADKAAASSDVAAEPPQFRWIQATVNSVANRENLPVYDAMRIAMPYLVSVHIGPQTKTAVPSELPYFPEERLPASDEGHELTVVFSAPSVLSEPQVETIFLPRVGPSNKCHFRVLIREGFEERSFEARIIVLHANRVIQTANLAVPIQRRGADAEGGGIRLLPEVVVRANLDELGGSERQPFAGTLLLNHNSSGIPGVTKIAGKNASYVGLEGAEASVAFFNEKLSSIVERPEKYDKLDSKATINLLRQFAQHGFALRHAIFGFNPAALDAVATGNRIQVISARLGAQLPVEFLYDLTAPADNATLCAGSAQGLLDGKCPTCPGTDKDPKQVICPLGFWGLNRVIERHLHDQQQRLTSADFALQSEPVRSARLLNLFTRALFAASNNVDEEVKGTTKLVSNALSSLTKKNSTRVDTWDKWSTEVSKKSPPLLILIPHTVEEAKVPGLEISDGQTLSLNDLTDITGTKYVRGNNSAAPVVVLMGCGTDAPPIGYHSFPLNFRLRGAAIVIGTGASIIGEHAAPVTEGLLRELAKVAQGSEQLSFGEVMLKVRRQMMARGLAMALCLTAYGDTDWMLKSGVSSGPGPKSGPKSRAKSARKSRATSAPKSSAGSAVKAARPGLAKPARRRPAPKSEETSAAESKATSALKSKQKRTHRNV